ncbi:hypothetical protein E2C01_097739 [Portunus trituberculatus]|uniref:Uncharacterized protein n=1 Tax=Portunus trituberculatus TaxID=210409 RepID=A0A5B7KAD3_PORTR|nr:hypothetical protein [Portunus trituberculatus]
MSHSNLPPLPPTRTRTPLHSTPTPTQPEIAYLSTSQIPPTSISIYPASLIQPPVPCTQNSTPPSTPDANRRKITFKNPQLARKPRR